MSPLTQTNINVPKLKVMGDSIAVGSLWLIRMYLFPFISTHFWGTWTLLVILAPPSSEIYICPSILIIIQYLLSSLSSFEKG